MLTCPVAFSGLTWPQSPMSDSITKSYILWNTLGKCHCKGIGLWTDTFWAEIIVLKRPLSWSTTVNLTGQNGQETKRLGPGREGKSLNIRLWGINTTLFPLDVWSSGYRTVLSLSLLLETYTSPVSVSNHRRGVFTLTLSSSTRNRASVPTTPKVSKLLHHCNSSLSEGCGFPLLKILFFPVYTACLPASLIFYSPFSIFFSLLSSLLSI